MREESLEANSAPVPRSDGALAQGPALTVTNNKNFPLKFNVFINKYFEGDMMEINLEFLGQLKANGFKCEVTRTGMKVSLTSMEHLCQFQRILQTHYVPYSLQTRKNKINNYQRHSSQSQP